MNRRICFLQHGYFPQDIRVKKQADALAACGYGVDVVALRLDGQPLRETVGDVQVFRVPGKHRRGHIIRYVFEYGLSFLMMFVQVSWLSIGRRYACIQVCTMPDALVFATVVARLLGTRILLDLREPMPELFVSIYGPNRMRFVVRMLTVVERLAIRYSHYVITVNDTIRQRFIDRGADGGKLGVVRNVPAEEFDRIVPPAVHGEGFMLCMHGTMQSRYGYDAVIRALPLLRGRIPGMSVLFLGSGQTENELRRLTDELGCADLITFAHPVPYVELARTLAPVDVGIVSLSPTPFGELCQPNKLFDYVALRIPVIVSRVKAIEESFDDSCIAYFEAGSPRDLARCILDLYADPAGRRSRAEAAFERYGGMRWRAAKHQYVEQVNLLIGTRLPAMRSSASSAPLR